MPNTTHGWVLVADSTQARILERQKDALEPVGEFDHPESREQGRDLMGNRPNENQHTMEKGHKGAEIQGLRDVESIKFAKELSGFLSTAHSQNRFRELVIVADPRFLGMLRAELGKPVTDAVTKSIGKNAVRLKPAELANVIANS